MSINNIVHTQLRTVKSFVLRQGRAARKTSRYTALWPLYGIEQQLNTMLDVQKVFAHSAPTVLEIGFGNGQSLLKMAIQHPELNFIGIEVYQAGIVQLLTGIEQHNLDNLKVMRGDAVEILRTNIADCSLQAIQLFFPDPWPKARHHKRRIVQNEFMLQVARKLLPQGVFRVATDWEHYALHIVEVMQQRVEFLPITDFSQQPAILPRDLTKFEQRGQQLGHRIYDLAYLLQSGTI